MTPSAEMAPSALMAKTAFIPISDGLIDDEPVV